MPEDTSHAPAAAVAAQNSTPDQGTRLTRAQWMVLAASFLGWAFDGVEIGLFPLIVRPALQDLGIGDDRLIAGWNSVVVACFLLGAALGGVVFGWLGDKIGRVRSMALSVLVYSVFTGMCYFATAPWQLGAFRFVASLGMGGEWALAVALVMECWPERHRPKLAGIIGAAANFGFLFISLVALTKPVTPDSWRWMMLVGASPAVLTFLIILFVPESERWKESTKRRAAPTGSDASLPSVRRTATATGVYAGIVAAYSALLWLAPSLHRELVSVVTGESNARRWLFHLAGLALAAWVFRCGSVAARRPRWFTATLSLGFLAGLGAWRYAGDFVPLILCVFFAIGAIGAAASVREIFSPQLRRSTLLAAVMSAVPLIGTWAAVSGWIPVWVDQMSQIEAGKGYLDSRQLADFQKAPTPKTQIEILKGALSGDQWQEVHDATARSKAWIQFVMSIGAIVGCLLAPVIGGRFARRKFYFALCVIALIGCAYLFRCLDDFDVWFVIVAGVVGAITAGFYGWLPLYLPELFPTRVRATGQGLSFNIGRVIAAFGVLYMGQLVALFGNDYGRAMAAITLVYVIGMAAVWFAPETKGKPLPD